MYGCVPPVTVRFIDPVGTPLINKLVPTVEQFNGAGSVNVTVHIVVHKLSSVTVTVYVPAAKPVGLAVVLVLSLIHI